MNRPIATVKVKLAPGSIGWYDSLTNTRLTMASPEAVVNTTKNLSGIKKGIKDGKIILKEGSLYSQEPEYLIPTISELPRKEVKKKTAIKTEKKKEEKTELPKKPTVTIPTVKKKEEEVTEVKKPTVTTSTDKKE